MRSETSAGGKPSLLANTASNWVALAVNILVGFLLTPYIIQSLGATLYGIWTLISAVVGYYGLLDIGLTSATMRYVSRYRGRRDSNSLNEVVNSSLALVVLIGLLVSAVTLVIPRPLAVFFRISAADYASFRATIIYLGLATAVALPGTFFSVILLAHEKFVIANAVKVIFTLLRALLAFLALRFDTGLRGISAVYFVVSILILIVNVILCLASFKELRFSRRFCSRSATSVLLSFGFYTIVIRVGNMLRLKIDEVVVGKVLAVESVGVYGVAALVFRYVSMVIIAYVGVTQPRLAMLAGKGTNEEFVESFYRYSRIAASLSVCVAVAAYALCSDFMRLWLPGSFVGISSSILILRLLIVGLLPDLMTDISVNALQAVNEHRYYAYQTVAEGMVNLVLSIVLARRIGIIGVALGTLVPSVIIKFIIQPLYCARLLKLSWRRYLLDSLLKPFAVFGFLILLYHLTLQDLLSESYGVLAVKAAVVLAASGIAVFFICLDQRSRTIVYRKAGEVLSNLTR